MSFTKKEIYLDYAATTPLDPRVLKAMEPYWFEIYGNPSSLNQSGRQAKRILEDSRRQISRILGARQNEVIFTSSATEANNLAIFGLINYFKKINPKLHIITTRIEHRSVLEPIKNLEKSGFKVNYLTVNSEGLIKINDLKNLLNKDTALVSIIYANNEIGSIQPIKKISKVIKEFNNLRSDKKFKTYFHVDAAQATNYLDINVNNLGVDLMTISSHKIYGPKGVACLYIKQETNIESLFFGGGQEFGLRPSTESVPLIVGFSKALLITQNLKEKIKKRHQKLRTYFVKNLFKLIPEAKINGPKNQENCLPNIISLSISGFQNESLILYLDKYKIRVSSGSACSSREMEPSYVLLAIGLSKELANSTIRISFGRQTSKEDLDYFLKILLKTIKKLRKVYQGLK